MKQPVRGEDERLRNLTNSRMVKTLSPTELIDLSHTGTVILQGSYNGSSHVHSINRSIPANRFQ